MTICAPVEVLTQTPCRATTRPSDDKARLLSGCRRFDGTMSSRTPCRATTRPSDNQARWLSGCPSPKAVRMPDASQGDESTRASRPTTARRNSGRQILAALLWDADRTCDQTKLIQGHSLPWLPEAACIMPVDAHAKALGRFERSTSSVWTCDLHA
ncbi:hypothetical protein PCASD_05649 [Puccinia coronata f. sp. avenae]|uniref:Uncharacterized protein n=1 Tax=Puccinia coronata f. sp. avenae TaxID=200324 RepID=A0A2N5UVF8_9BASI|nr:hypothetical protein PCASD_05649 [Puccinia coronata f. sp. avenae]